MRSTRGRSFLGNFSIGTGSGWAARGTSASGISWFSQPPMSTGIRPASEERGVRAWRRSQGGSSWGEKGCGEVRVGV